MQGLALNRNVLPCPPAFNCTALYCSGKWITMASSNYFEISCNALCSLHNAHHTTAVDYD